ncbi:MAG TPA: hypothetical protein VER32_05635 [Pyrinomonadaceae bacterium]|nr:hypothetical protein [Pyrinomonadaceae bacterium]
MDWVKGISDVLQQYQGATPDQAPATVEDDFDQMATNAPPSAVADGLSEAFRSEQTPPFPNMLGQVFQQSSGTQRASILNELIAAVGPTVLSQILSRAGGGQSGAGGGAGTTTGSTGSTGASGGGLTGGGGGILDQILGGVSGAAAGAQQEATPQVTPQQAEQIPLDVVESIAAQAEQRDPSIIDRVSDIYARQPGLVKTLGAAALTVALAKIAARMNR